MIYDSILVGSGPINIIEAIYLTKKGQKVLVLEQSNYLGGAWGKVPLGDKWPSFQLGCHIWDVEPQAFKFISELLELKLTKLTPQPKFVVKGIQLPYDWKNLMFYIRGKLRPKAGLESVSLKKARLIPAQYIYPEGGSLEFIDKLLQKASEFGVEMKTGIKVERIETGDVNKLFTSELSYESKEVVLTSVSQINSISKGDNSLQLPKPRLVEYIHCHLIIEDKSKAKFSYVRLPGNNLIHRISDESNHVKTHGINLKDKKLVLAGIYPSMYHKYSKEELSKMIMKTLFKRKYIGNNASLIDSYWNVFETHYIPKEIRPKIVDQFQPNVRLLHSTNFIFSVRDNCNRWAKELFN